MQYWIQDCKSTNWVDMFGFETEGEAREFYNKLLADPIWHNAGKRKWRLVQRINAILEETHPELAK